jgi:hypothetical protein
VRWKRGPTLLAHASRTYLPFAGRVPLYTTVSPPPNRTEAVRCLIDLEEDEAARAVVFGLLAEMQRK